VRITFLSPPPNDRDVENGDEILGSHRDSDLDPWFCKRVSVDELMALIREWQVRI